MDQHFVLEINTDDVICHNMTYIFVTVKNNTLARVNTLIRYAIFAELVT